MNQNALVTGASRGIGKEIVSKLRESGIQVITPTRIEMDLTSDQSITKYLSTINVSIDILVNCAGILKVGEISDLTSKDFHNILQVNLVAPFQIISELANGMKKRKYGRIVNISSIWGTVSREGRSIYSASKAGLDGLTRSLAIELSPYNILVNSIAPGYVSTELIFQSNTSQDLDKIKEKIPLNRFAQPSEIAEYVRFLCSEKNSYITGQVLTIDGGYLCR